MDKWFNNPEESDIEIALSSGKILYSHRIILKTHSKMLEGMLSDFERCPSNKKIAIPGFSDEALLSIVKLFYVEKFDKILEPEIWFESFRLAHYLISDKAVVYLLKNTPSGCHTVDIIQLADDIKCNELMNAAVKLTCAKLNVVSGNKLKEYCESFQRLELITYTNFRMILKESKNQYTCSDFATLCLDCYYCDMNTAGRRDQLNEFIADINFASFIKPQLDLVLELPGIKTSPIFTNFIKCIISSKWK